MGTVALGAVLLMVRGRGLVRGSPVLMRPPGHHRRTMRRRHPGSRDEAEQAGGEEEGAEHGLNDNRWGVLVR